MNVHRYEVLFVALFTWFAVLANAKPKVDEAEWNCMKSCEASGKEADFDYEFFICTCVEPEIAPPDIPEDGNQQTFRRKKRLLPLKDEENNNEDSIVGQSFPIGPLPITHDNARRMLIDVKQKLRNLANQNPASRAAAAQIDGIRATLRDLSQRLVVGSPQQRAKLMANRARLVEQRKARHMQIQHRLRKMRGGGLLPRRGIVGASANEVTTESEAIHAKNSEDNEERSDEDSVVPNYSSKGVITQPVNLIEE